MLVAASTGGDAAAVVLVLIMYIAPFFVARRIGLRKGRRWFWYALFLGWIGVLLLALLNPTRMAASAHPYHEPPGLASQRHRYKNSPLYDQRRR